eukprot:m.237513 g.237513  ORF g.237513 m.237513 type:complete len:56 (-) comp13927_c1_seq26:577-744(-)
MQFPAAFGHTSQLEKPTVLFPLLVVHIYQFTPMIIWLLCQRIIHMEDPFRFFESC